MNAADVVMYGQGTFLAGLDNVPQSEWDLPDVCGYWSVRQIVTHIASYEAMFADVLAIVTEWKEFRSPDFDRIKKELSEPVIFDGRNLYDPTFLARQGFTYYAIGRGKPLPV